MTYEEDMLNDIYGPAKVEPAPTKHVHLPDNYDEEGRIAVVSREQGEIRIDLFRTTQLSQDDLFSLLDGIMSFEAMEKKQ